MPSAPRVKKRLIVCCDGTWMDSDDGYIKPSHNHPKGRLQVPSNVTRISRCFKRRCSDGTLQVISYLSGVGTGSTLDTLTGGLFGQGLSERVREAYSYLCANYSDGDEIVLVGFSRGAFTARSVAGIVGNLGLLTREGVEYFYPIFKDMQNWMNRDYDDPFPTLPFSKKPKGPDAPDQYRRRLEKMGLTRVTQKSGELIKIKAVCVWDTVGSLGIPTVGILDKFGIRPSNDDTFKWHDTDLSDRIEHAFQALALDETRMPFSPAVWERRPQNKLTTDLRQVWFPGNHGNVGGGWEDQSMSNISLAWMMDQMASIGAEFDKSSLDRMFREATDYFRNLSAMVEEHGLPQPPQWAIDPVYHTNRPVRPWGLGEIQQTSGIIHWLGGNETRTPGQYKQTDPHMEHDTNQFLLDTNERVHSSVRIRLTCGGLGLNDQSIWSCAALSNWRLRRTNTKYKDPVPRNPTWGMNGGDPDKYAGRRPNEKEGDRYIWEYAGPERSAPTDPKQRVMVEEPLGPYERYLLKFSGGKPNVYEFAEGKEVQQQPREEKRRGRSGREKEKDKHGARGRRYSDSDSDSEWEDVNRSSGRNSKR